MTKIDTSADVLDALLSEIHFQGSLREDRAAPDKDASAVFAKAWQTIKALVAERDAAQQQANEGRQAEVDADTERQAAEADRDRLAARVVELEALVRRAQPCVRDLYETWHADARAALAGSKSNDR